MDAARDVTAGASDYSICVFMVVLPGRGAVTTTAISSESEPYPASACSSSRKYAEESYALELLSEPTDVRTSLMRST